MIASDLHSRYSMHLNNDTKSIPLIRPVPAQSTQQSHLEDRDPAAIRRRSHAET